MLMTLKKWWWKRSQLHSFEKIAVQYEYKALNPALKAKNLRGLISLHKKDIELHKAELLDLEKERDDRKKYTDTDLVKVYQQEYTDSVADHEEMKKNLPADKLPEAPAEYKEQGAELVARLRKENNEAIATIESDIKNHKTEQKMWEDQVQEMLKSLQKTLNEQDNFRNQARWMREQAKLLTDPDGYQPKLEPDEIPK